MNKQICSPRYTLYLYNSSVCMDNRILFCLAAVIVLSAAFAGVATDPTYGAP